jgi:hypothetical protein
MRNPTLRKPRRVRPTVQESWRVRKPKCPKRIKAWAWKGAFRWHVLTDERAAQFLAGFQPLVEGYFVKGKK